MSPSIPAPLAFDPTDPVALTQALIRCASVTPAEGGALTLLDAVLSAEGFSVERPTFSEPGMPDIENLYARIGSEGPVFVIAGHTDVVPPGDLAAWTHDPFAADIVDGTLFGRGACDMKGGLAAMVCAAIRYRRANPDAPGSIAFLVTGDEEGPAVNGTVKLLAWADARGERFDHCLLGEPTNPAAMSDMIKIGRRGSLTGKLAVQGIQGHVGYPHLAQNPIRDMVRLLAALDATPLDAGTEHFDPSNLEVTTLDVGNPATNVIPAHAKAVFNIRFNDLWTPETLAAEIERRLREAAGNTVRYEISFEPTNAVAFLTQPGPFVAMVAEAVEAETGKRPALSTTGGTSDARFIKNYCPVVEYGVVGQTMHQIDERVAVTDLVTLERITHRLLAGYFAAAQQA
ncbi:Succinyl-diaminopimelate desuccinylase [Bosea sp. 62]|uniref:succinyl-diaminopimelate desuccinylase n=1 Tax=unclassified Bosea (in: a-proteobacteria) TaxID=2653178 RepID=UPI001253465C|nr:MULTISPECIES: succinyl-diaminopimelate desuccinylase [unclassified Bosea (in: a-proteobacteria)]CAD5295752.1 Succinyl-diaminopimelate desuccinylase [Bosea sp. 21B]CAD5296098.1 Succinyl-diaminopimelate desuccinylase [Bosea sp. 46]CAD5297901.1 Succinyl-diaminopimelate desuccinylase [Bosea sp. 7B]VVT61045.1 Succinyl-diaminopimelate desuccinylase [Bosea sp. EC-HK365B]VXB12317.1 Succinyl-diaminopimelate desuccinylase [Bosea sp. 125]